MPNVYLRVPHYVASYFRNKNRTNRISVGGAIHIDPSDPLFSVIVDKLTCNSSTINRAYCFCARQWKRMMKGYAPNETNTRKSPILSELEDELTLSDDEVGILSGLLPPRNSDKGEYLCIVVPREIFKQGRMWIVNDHWQFSWRGTFAIRNAMTEEFWRALFAYLDTRREMCNNSRGRKYIVMEGLESFMERYDIRNSTEDQHELQTLKRGMNRKRHAFKFSEEDYVEHG